MGGALKHAEHASHAGHHGGPGKMIGLTMACLGVLLAICAANVGGQRTELTRALVEQTQSSAESQANQMKYRLVMLQLEKSRAQLAIGPDGKPIPGGVTDPVESRTLDRNLALYDKYSTEKEANKTWVKKFDPLIHAHFEAAEGYDHAQLSAEVGIVICSIALLLGSRGVWFVSLVFGAGAVGMFGMTMVQTDRDVSHSHHELVEARDAYNALRKLKDPNKEDAATVDQLDPGGKRRAAIAAAIPKELPNDVTKDGANGGGEHKPSH